MKQLLVMIALTLAGTAGTYLVRPFWGVAVYYLFAVLRPQYLWEWALPQGIAWSFYVAIATLLAAVLSAFGIVRLAAPLEGTGRRARTFTRAHLAVFAFAAWIAVTCATARNTAVSSFWFIEYLKIFLMFATAAVLIRRLADVWALVVITALALGYIGYEMNMRYLLQGYLDIYKRGYGGLDNNGAGLMLATGVPLCIFAWEAERRRRRWIFAAIVPFLVHAVLMSYSRGAMLSLLVASPLMFWRTRRKRVALLASVALALMVSVMAGQEIRDRFMTISRNDADESAQSRLGSWAAAIRIAEDNPIFGVGVRNANLFSYRYGADMEGRTIHSQYLQTLADSGFPALGLYLLALFFVFRGLHEVERACRSRARDEPDALRAYAMAAGVECALAVFCVGAAFLSLEVFELPYVLLLVGAELPLLVPPPPAGRPEPAGGGGRPAAAALSAAPAPRGAP
jgi:probable O-glycosylation ligase (exosortase A-associated)